MLSDLLSSSLAESGLASFLIKPGPLPRDGAAHSELSHPPSNDKQDSFLRTNLKDTHFVENPFQDIVGLVV